MQIIQCKKTIIQLKGDNSIQSEQICLHNSDNVTSPDAVEVSNSNLKNDCSQPKLDIKNSESIRTNIDSTTDIVDDSTSVQMVS